MSAGRPSALNPAGAAASCRFAVVIAIISLAVLLVFCIASLTSGRFSWDNLWNIAPEAGGSTFLPLGVGGVLAALPFAIWFLLGIEELPPGRRGDPHAAPGHPARALRARRPRGVVPRHHVRRRTGPVLALPGGVLPQVLSLTGGRRVVVVGVGVFFAIGLAYFAIRGRHHLVFSPEEEYAMPHGHRGAHPDSEGYYVTDRLGERAPHD